MRTLPIRLICAALLAVPCAVQAQQYPARPCTAAPSTPAEDRAIGAGIDLHDQGKFDEAIARYQEVLKENPANLTALYELGFSYAAKKDYQKSLDTAAKGIEFKSDLLPMFYDLLASTHDSMGDPQRAIAAYKRGVELAPDASVLYFNMAVTYQESLKDPASARQALEQAITIEPESGEAQRLLGQLFQTDGYKTPAMLVLGRFLVLADDNARGALQAYGLWRAVLRGNDDPARPTIPAAAPKLDEGDFTAIDRLIDPSHLAASKAQDGGTTEIQALVGQLDTILAQLAARDPGADRASFVGRHYVPDFAELKRKNFVEPFAYWVSQRAPVPGVREWLDGNPDRVREFLTWSKNYRWAN